MNRDGIYFRFGPGFLLHFPSFLFPRGHFFLLADFLFAMQLKITEEV